MSEIAIQQQYYYHRAVNHTSSGVGTDSAYISRSLDNLRSHKMSTAVGGQPLALKSQILDIQKDCSIQDWDGYGAYPINRTVATMALRLVDLLPNGLQDPEIVPEPEGLMGFEWISESGDRLLITPKDNSIIYASIIGDNTSHGKINLGNELPEEISKISY